MSPRRFHIQKQDIIADSIVLRGGEARHIARVLRLGKNDQVILFDNDGTEYHGIIEESKGGGVRVKINTAKSGLSHDACAITLAQAVIKSDKMNFITQKCTELGVAKILPFFSARTVPRWSGSTAGHKIQRLQDIAIAAVKQSGIRRVPTVEQAVGFADVMQREYGGYLKLILWEKETDLSLKKALRSAPSADRIIFVVGPEGGFTDEEMRIARKNGFLPVGLGRFILRSETVPMTVLAILRYEYGSMEYS